MLGLYGKFDPCRRNQTEHWILFLFIADPADCRPVGLKTFLFFDEEHRAYYLCEDQQTERPHDEFYGLKRHH